MSESLIPLAGDPGDEQDEELEQQQAPDEQQVPETQEPAEEEEMPDDLLTPAELEERNRERAAKPAPVAAAPAEDRHVSRDELLGIITAMREPAPTAEPQPQQRQAPRRLTDEEAIALSDKVLATPGGVARALENVAALARRQALEDVEQNSGGILETTGEAAVDRFVARMLRDPSQKFSKKIEPKFNETIAKYDMAQVARMPVADRNAWLEGVWKQVGYDTLMGESQSRPAPSPGVARGAGTRSGPPNRQRVVLRMTDAQKKELRASAPSYFSGVEGEKRFQRQVWEIEHGVTGDTKIARAVGESERFANAVGFAG